MASTVATLKPRIFQSTLQFAREGDSHGTNQTVGRESKPSDSDAAWLDLGVVQEADWTLEPIKETEILRPMGGRLVPYDRIRAGARATIKITLGEFDYLHLEQVFYTGKLTESSTSATVLGGSPKRGWLRFKLSDQDVAPDGNPTVKLDCWCELKLANPMPFSGGEPANVQLEALVLYSSLNTLAFGTT